MDTIRHLESLRRREHAATVELIVALCECARREDHVAAGYASIWALLVERLQYSPAAASRRNAAAKIARHHPVALEILRAHRTSLTCLAKIAHLLRADDFARVLRSIDGATSDEVDRLLAARRPVAKPRERVRRTVVRRAGSAAELNLDVGDAKAESDVRPATSAAEVKPVLTEDRVVLTFSITADGYAAFQRARAKASRKHGPGVTIEQTLHEMVDHYVDRDPAEPRAPKPAATRTRHIPAATRRAVTRRDGRQCTFVAPDGTRCSATHDLQVDHVAPFAEGGSHAASNLRLLCGTHNRFRVRRK